MLSRLAVLIVACIALAACSPEYNWRELDVANGQVKAAFPARVQTDSRDLPLADIVTPYTLTTARVNDALFAVGYAALPEALALDPAHRSRLGLALLRSAYLNMGVEPPESLALSQTPLEIVGQGSRQGTHAWVKVWETPNGLVQATAVGKAEDLSADRAREFINQVVVHRSVRP